MLGSRTRVSAPSKSSVLVPVLPCEPSGLRSHVDLQINIFRKPHLGSNTFHTCGCKSNSLPRQFIHFLPRLGPWRNFIFIFKADTQSFGLKDLRRVGILNRPKWCPEVGGKKIRKSEGCVLPRIERLAGSGSLPDMQLTLIPSLVQSLAMLSPPAQRAQRAQSLE